MPPHILWIYSTTLLTLTAIGVIVFLNKRKEKANKAFLFFTISTILWILFLYSSYAVLETSLDLSLILFRLTYGASVLILSSLSLFFYYFPRKNIEFQPFTMVTVYGATFLVAALCAFTPLVEESIYIEGEVQVDVFGPLYALYLQTMLFHMVLATVLLVGKFFKVTGIERKQLLYTSLGFFLFIFSAVMTNVVLPVFDIFIFQAEAPAFTLFFSFLVLFAIYKQRFFRFSFIALGVLRFSIIFAIFISISVGAYFIFSWLFTGLNTLLVYTLSISIGYFANSILSKYFPDLYSPGFHQLRNALAEFNYEILNAKTHDQIDDKIQKTFEEKLNIKNVRLYILEAEGMGDDIATYREDGFTEKLAKAKDVVVLEELLLESKKTQRTAMLIENMQELGAALCIPLRREGRMIGFLKLGERQRKKSYSREEIDEIYKVIPSLEVALMNILINDSLREENDIMKEIIHARTKTLKKNNKKLEEMIEQQNNFISLTAHEFRTPLTVAMLGLEQISYTHKGKVSAEIAEDIQTSHEQLDKLTQLINRLLEMRRVDDDRIPVNLEKVDIVKLVRDTTKGMNLLAEQEEKEVSYSGPKAKKIVKTDEVKLKEVIDNLIQNAIKFSKKGGKIEITLRISKKEEKAFVKIKDYGRGIRKKDQKIIFDKFQQGSQYNQGVGIGLYLCKKYMHLLKGDITVSSKLGHGSTFIVEIPLTTP